MNEQAPDSQTEIASSDNWKPFAVRAAIAAAGLVVVMFTYKAMFSTASNANQTAEAKQEEPAGPFSGPKPIGSTADKELTPEDVMRNQRQAETIRLQQQEERKNQANKDQLEKLTNTVRGVESLIAAYEEERLRWENEILSLAKSEAGKQITGTESAVVTYWNLAYETERPEPSFAKMKSNDVRKILEGLESELAGSVFSPPDDYLKSRIEQLKESIQTETNRLNRDRNTILDMIAGSEPGPLTIAEAYEERRTKLSKEKVAKIEEEVAKAEKKGRELEAKAAAQKTLDEANAEAMRIKREGQAVIDAQKRIEQEQITKHKEEERQRAAEKKKTEDIAKIALPEVKTALAYFLQPGYFQPPNEIGSEKVPVSLSKLRSAGYLAETKAGAELLLQFVWNAHKKDKERTLAWNVNYFGRRDESEYPRAYEVQKLLNELGDTLVELEMLSK